MRSDRIKVSEAIMFLKPCLIIVISIFRTVLLSKIELPECEPPDVPEGGGYGPMLDKYLAGDRIHYFCNTDRYIGGNFLRICEDTGHWSGHTPVCDSPAKFAFVNQTSTTEPVGENDAEMATDSFQNTCSSTRTGEQSEWFGLLETPGEIIRVMTFVPTVEVAFEVYMVKSNGSELRCDIRREGFVEQLNWEFHNCNGPHNRDVIGVKIKSLSPSIPLQLCDVIAHVLTDPHCPDPGLMIENGHVQLSRKKASLVCLPGYKRASHTATDCIRTGKWARKILVCEDHQWEVPSRESNPRRPDP